MRRVLPLLFLVATSLHAAIELPREKEKWISTTVDDFTITSNAGERETIDVATNLLRMREAVGRITSLKVRSGVPTSVILFRNARSFAPYRDALMQTDGTTFTGLYLSREDTNYILLQADSAAGIDRVVSHELVHSFLRNTAPGAPLWFNEGIAEYYSTFDTRGTRVEIGRPIEQHVHWLREQRRLIPLAELFAIDTSSPTYDERTRAGVFYAQSWALVHYLLAGNQERRRQLPKLLSLLMAGRSADDAARGAFGIDVAQLELELRRYVQQRAFTFTAYKLDELKTSAVPTPEPIAHDEVLYRLGALLARGGLHTMADGETHLREALKRNPAHAGAHASLGMIHEAKGRDAEATKSFEEAVRLGTRDATAYLVYGATLLNRREATRARQLFEKAVELAPASARAWAGLGATYVITDASDPAGIRALEKSLALAPGQRDVALGLVQLYARAGRRDDAQKLVDTAIAPSGDAMVLRLARQAVLSVDLRRAMKLLEEQKTDEAIPILRAIAATTDDPTMKSHIERAIADADAHRLINAQADAINAAITLANSGKRAEAAAALDKLIPEITNAELLAWAKEVREKLPKRRGK